IPIVKDNGLDNSEFSDLSDNDLQISNEDSDINNEIKIIIEIMIYY
ncbi:5190_t:CDS:2, partial [Funneliformis mosseae]